MLYSVEKGLSEICCTQEGNEIHTRVRLEILNKDNWCRCNDSGMDMGQQEMDFSDWLQVGNSETPFLFA
jgi:hypothetical protein